MRPSLLMCPPDHFGIEYEINPWMSLRRQVNKQVAHKQWQELCEFLGSQLEVDIQLIEPVPGLPDMVFTANAGLARGGKFISSNFRKHERAGESKYYEAWFRGKGYSICNLPQEYYFEGEGDVLFADNEDAYAGYIIRSDANSHAMVADLLGVRIISMELTNLRFYHLDTCFCPLDSESVVYYPGAFDSYGLEVIKANFPDRIEVTEEEAEQFVCNAVVIENYYVQPKGGRKALRPALESRGYTVHEFDLSEFIKAGGATKCLVLKLD